MSVLNIRKAQREGARLVIGFSGISGSGKTLTALYFAYGLADYDASKVGFIDAENRRGSLYSDALRGHPTHPTSEPFLIGDLYAPFSPKRYKEAILEFQRAGVSVLVIDSVSHEWEGEGGCEDIAHAGTRMADWKTAKREHKSFMNALLQSDMHVIVCIRAREKTDFKDPKNPKSLGIQPICEKNFLFELTASLMMWDEGRAQSVIKCPAELQGHLGRESGYITAADGAAVRAWVDGAKQLDPRIEHARNTLRTVTEKGMDALVKTWRALPDDIRKAISPSGTCPDEFKSAAQDFDAQRARDGGRQLEDLNDQILGGAGAQDDAA